MLTISVVCIDGLVAAQTPVQTIAPVSRPPGYAEVSAVHASDAQQLPEPFNPALHRIFIIGDSTAAYHIDRMNEGYAEAQGWGVFFYAFFDPDKVNIANLSRGGRSTRTYLTEGLWDKAVAQFKPGDVVLLQLGQNDVFALNDQIARGTIPDISDESEKSTISPPTNTRRYTRSAGTCASSSATPKPPARSRSSCPSPHATYGRTATSSSA